MASSRLAGPTVGGGTGAAGVGGFPESYHDTVVEGGAGPKDPAQKACAAGGRGEDSMAAAPIKGPWPGFAEGVEE
jgi:hypothetical protein